MLASYNTDHSRQVSTTTQHPSHTQHLDEFLDDPLVHQTPSNREGEPVFDDADTAPDKKRTNRRAHKHQQLEARLEQIEAELADVKGENLELRQIQERDHVEGDLDPLLLQYDETEKVKGRLRRFENAYGSFAMNRDILEQLANLRPGDIMPGMSEHTGIIEDEPGPDEAEQTSSNDRIASLEEEIKDLKGVLASRGFDINGLHVEVSNLEQNITRLEWLVEASDAKLKLAQEDLEERAKDLNDSRTEITRLERQLRDLRQGHQLSPSTLELITAGHKRVVERLEETVRTLKVDIDQQRIKRNEIGRRFEKRVSYLAQLRKVLRDNGIPLPQPLKGMEFSWWDDDRNPAEVVAAFRNGR